MKPRPLDYCVALAAAALAASGCSDDVVCPNLEPQAAVYVSAELVERDGQTPATYIGVAATADPLPSLLAAFVNGTRLPDVQAQGLGLVATLESDVVLWQPGDLCSLEVTTDYGYATSAVTLPEPALPRAPETVAPGETLVISWNRAGGADYYRISGSFDATTRDTQYVYVIDETFPEDFVSGKVDAVAGPFPASGSEGNVSGEAWGFFTASYGDSGSFFSVSVSPGSR